MSDKPKVLTAEDIKRIAGKGHHCGWERMPSYFEPTDGCQCKCGVSYDENWNGIISHIGRQHLECKCKPVPHASGETMIERCQERNPETGQCELRAEHSGKHLAGYLMWAAVAATSQQTEPVQVTAQQEELKKIVNDIVDDLIDRGFVTRVCGDDSVARTIIFNAMMARVELLAPVAPAPRTAQLKWFPVDVPLPAEIGWLLIKVKDSASNEDWYTSPVMQANPIFVNAHLECIEYWAELLQDVAPVATGLPGTVASWEQRPSAEFIVAPVETAPLNQRGWDLLRQMRHKLHEENLISDEEYAELVAIPGSVKRLEDYDKAIAKLSKK
jgi:hypothetical protein